MKLREGYLPKFLLCSEVSVEEEMDAKLNCL